MSQRFSRAALGYATILSLLLLMAGLPAVAQSARLSTSNFNAWTSYNGHFLLTQKWGFMADVQIRRNDGYDRWQQLLLRGGVIYAVTDNVLATVGAAYIETYPYGEVTSVKTNYPEHRYWQQIQLTQPNGIVDVISRLRLEQRFIGSPATGTYTDVRYENRLRFMERLNITLSKDRDKNTRWYIPAYDEIFIAFGENVKYNTFDQNRAFIGIGLNEGRVGKFELGYLYQYVQQRNLLPDLRQVIENNHTLSVAWYMFLKRGNAGR